MRLAVGDQSRLATLLEGFYASRKKLRAHLKKYEHMEKEAVGDDDEDDGDWWRR